MTNAIAELRREADEMEQIANRYTDLAERAAMDKMPNTAGYWMTQAFEYSALASLLRNTISKATM